MIKCASVFLFLILSLTQAIPAFPSDIKIFASNYPLAYFAERISGNPITVFTPNTEGDPADWRPSIEDILIIQQAKVILLNGAGYEKWINTVTLPTSKIVDTSVGFKDHYLIREGGISHQHGPEGAHTHHDLASTTWIDFSLAAQQALAVKKALLKAGVEKESTLQRNYEKLEEELLGLDTEFLNATRGFDHIPLIASHPVYDYFAVRYQLNIKSVHWEPSISLTEDMLTGLQQLVKNHQAQWMIWENQPIGESVKRLEVIGVHSVVFNPGGQRPDQGDFLSMMRENLNNLRSILSSADK